MKEVGNTMICQQCKYEFYSDEKESYFCPECATIVEDNLPDLPGAESHLKEMLKPLKKANDYLRKLYVSVIFITVLSGTPYILTTKVYYYGSHQMDTIEGRAYVWGSVYFVAFYFLFNASHFIPLRFILGDRYRIFHQKTYLLIKYTIVIIVIIMFALNGIPNHIAYYITERGADPKAMQLLRLTMYAWSIGIIIVTSMPDFISWYLHYKSKEISEKFERWLYAVSF